MVLDSNFNGSRLREARRYRGLSITDLARELGVTKQMVSKYENGKATPPLESTFTLMKTLGFPREFFFSKDLFEYKDEGTYFRSQLTAVQGEKEVVTYDKKYAAIIRDYFEAFISFPELIENHNISDLDDVESITLDLRKNWGLEDTPIVDIMRLMEEKGFVISVVKNEYNKVDASGGSANINGREYYIVMIEGDDYSFYRQQFSLAHELGHWILDKGNNDPEELEKDEYKEMEQRANNFASSFLLPKDAFIKSVQGLDLAKIESYLGLKRIWFVSIGTLIMRAKALKLISSDEFVKLQKQINYRKWRKNEPYDDTKQAMRPVALKQSLDLLVDNDIINREAISSEIFRKYGVFLSNEIIEKICGLEKGYLVNSASVGVKMDLK
ncbi:XRE family transcriptional regulator [Enterococcus sp. BWT-B8]|uniref:helix-turn-helix domain-containing protein n=1 Tax=Enterococcus sp. BWT-B8 TaxID=2885157 RepID=UPI001E5CEF36|nr:XRE family transcriptional regulator [Enterococcus sp. BWT-B8]MCB5952357.1 XRE family transcriptional regulator [Enterococcus sp. BWT-B8]